MFHRFRLERSRLTRALGAALLGVAAAGQALGNVLSDGGFESAYDYPCMYPHENARIKAFVDAGWDVGGVDKFRFPAVWTVRPAPAGYLRVSDDARGGRYALEFGKGGVIYAGSYVTPTESVGRYPFTEGHSCIIRVWAKGTGTLTARIREYAASGVRDVDVGAPESLTGDWRECIFLYTPEATAPEFIEVGFTADGVAKVDDAAMVDVVEFSRLVASLNDGLKTAQADARDGLVPTTAVEAVAAEVGGLAGRAGEAGLPLPAQLALRDEIAPVARRLEALVWQGRGQRAGRLGLASDRLRVEFYGSELHFRLASVADPAGKVEFLGPFGSEVWRLRLVNPGWKSGLDAGAQPPAKLYLTSDSKCDSLSSALSARGRKLTLKWLGVEVPGARGKLDVCVTVALPKGERLARWHIRVSGGVPDVALNEVHFPLLATLTPMTAEGRDDYLLLPHATGRLVRNPYRGESFSPWMTMQMWALYSEKAGLYAAAEDGDWYQKSFQFTAVQNERLLHAQTANLPENNMTGGNAYDMPYEAVIGTFDGNWWDASRIYRRWAVEQKWCRELGPLHSARGTSQWCKDLPLFLLMYETAGGPEATEEDVLSGKVTAAMQGDYRSLYPGLPFAFHYYGWEKGHKGYGQGGYFPPGFGLKGWPRFIRQLHERGARVVPYVQGTYFNTKFDWYTQGDGKKGELYFAGGAPFIYGDAPNAGYENMTSMCQASAAWQDYHVEVAKMLATCGVDGIYFDSFPGWQSCYNPAHGHPLGGGRYLADGNRRLIARVREAVRATNPDLAFVSENVHESMVGALDGSLQYMYAALPDNVPLFSSVYHDYMLFWGNTFSARYETWPPWAHVAIACQFVRGDQLGEIGGAWTQEPALTTYLAGLRFGPGRKFLTYGQMLEPPRFLNDVPTVTTPPWHELGGERDPRSFPAVLASAWKAPDGTFGLVLVNIADKEQEVEYEVDVQRRELPFGPGQACEVRDRVSGIALGSYAEPILRRRDAVLPRQARILEFGGRRQGD